jgi:V8-like Glu-specific endopeptidase
MKRLISLCVFLTACGDSGPSTIYWGSTETEYESEAATEVESETESETGTGIVWKLPSRPAQASDELFGNLTSEVSVASTTNASEGVGMLVRKENGLFTQCTASLVGPDLILTNSHCISAEQRKAGALCKNIGFTLPAIAERQIAESVHCQEIVYASSINFAEGALKTVKEYRPDYAFLRLERALKAKPLKINREPLKNGDLVRISKVNPSTSWFGVRGEMETVKCTLFFESLQTEVLDNGMRPVLNYGDCVTIGGNSGSPILDAKGEIRGVHFASSKFTDMTVANSDALTFIYTETLSPSFSVGTSATCLFDPREPEAYRPPECFADMTLNISQSITKHKIRRYTERHESGKVWLDRFNRLVE